MRKCLITGLFNNIAELQSDNHYVTISSNRQRVKIHPSSVFCDKEKPKLILFSELIATGRTYVRTVTSLESEWVTEFLPKLMRNANLANSNGGNSSSNNRLNGSMAGGSSSSFRF